MNSHFVRYTSKGPVTDFKSVQDFSYGKLIFHH